MGQTQYSQVAQVAAMWHLYRRLADGKDLCCPLADGKVPVLPLFILFFVISKHFHSKYMIYIYISQGKQYVQVSQQVYDIQHIRNYIPSIWI